MDRNIMSRQIQWKTSVEASSLGGQPSQAYNEMTEEILILKSKSLEEGNIIRHAS